MPYPNPRPVRCSFGAYGISGLVLLLAAWTLAGAGCDVGTVLDNQNIDVPDAGADDPDAAEVACVPAANGVGDGHHNPGTVCADCHSPGGTGPTWSLAGTAYTSSAGGTPVIGATIVVIE